MTGGKNVAGRPDHAAEEYRVVPAKATEPKVAAATGGAGLGAAIALFMVWGLDELFWNGAAPPDVPGQVSGLVWVAVPALVAFLAGRLAPHVERFTAADE